MADQYILVMLALTEAHCQLGSVRIIHPSMRPLAGLNYKHIIICFYFDKNILIQIKFML